MIISPDGVNGLCYEHSPSEAVAVIQLMEEFIDNCKDFETKAKISPDIETSCDAIKPIQWNLSTILEKHVRDACQSIDK